VGAYPKAPNEALVRLSTAFYGLKSLTQAQVLEQALAAVDCKKGENTKVARLRTLDDVHRYTVDVQISTE
jgi:hypothetical protein